MLNFILSSGRTGTVYINNIIKDLPNITVEHERHGNLLRILNHIKLKGCDNSILKNLVVYLSIHNVKNNNTIHIEINNMISSYIEDVAKLFPEANFIHIVRDPRSYVKSAVNWTYNQRLKKHMVLNFPFWAPRPNKYTLGSGNKEKLFEIFTKHWKISNSNFYRLKNTNKYYLYKFEDLENNSLEFMKSLLTTCGYEDESGLTKLINEKDKNQSSAGLSFWTEWTTQLALYLHNNCQELAIPFNYLNEEEWLLKIKNS